MDALKKERTGPADSKVPTVVGIAAAAILVTIVISHFLPSSERSPSTKPSDWVASGGASAQIEKPSIEPRRKTVRNVATTEAVKPDYDYNPDGDLPHVGDVAKNFVVCSSLRNMATARSMAAAHGTRYVRQDAIDGFLRGRSPGTGKIDAPPMCLPTGINEYFRVYGVLAEQNLYCLGPVNFERDTRRSFNTHTECIRAPRDIFTKTNPFDENGHARNSPGYIK